MHTNVSVFASAPGASTFEGMTAAKELSLARFDRSRVGTIWTTAAPSKRAAIFTGLRKLAPNILNDLRNQNIPLTSTQWAALEKGTPLEKLEGMDEDCVGKMLGYIAEMYWAELLAVTPRH